MKKSKQHKLPSRPAKFELTLTLTDHLIGARTSAEISDRLLGLAADIHLMGTMGVEPAAPADDGIISYETNNSKVAAEFGFAKRSKRLLELLARVPTPAEKAEGKAILAELEAKIMASLAPTSWGTEAAREVNPRPATSHRAPRVVSKNRCVRRDA